MFEEMQKGWVCLLARRYLQGGRGVRCVRQLVLLAAIAPPRYSRTDQTFSVSGLSNIPRDGRNAASPLRIPNWTSDTHGVPKGDEFWNLDICGFKVGGALLPS